MQIWEMPCESQTVDHTIATLSVISTQRCNSCEHGRQPSDDDVKWSRLNKELMLHAGKGDWGLYRNARFSMAEILRRDNRPEAALYTYLEVCYLDLNGPRNMGGVTDRSIIKEFPPFDQSMAFLAGGVTGRISSIMKQLGITLPDVKPKFLEQNTQLRKALKLPLDVEKAWQSIEKDFASHNHA